MRQIIGWREYVWGMYWRRRDRGDALGAERALPAAFWGDQGWNCLDPARRGGGSLRAPHRAADGARQPPAAAGVEPWAAVRVVRGTFIDGAEWVMVPNMIGMALFADGGR